MSHFIYRYTECRYAECRYVECRGAFKTPHLGMSHKTFYDPNCFRMAVR